MNAKRARPVDDPKALVPFGWAPGNYHCAACAMCGEAHSGSDKRSIRCQDCAETLRDAPTAMTHPLTPREKVEYWLNLALTTGANRQDFNMSEAVSGILTALASDSGDHAELARLAEAATPGEWELDGHQCLSAPDGTIVVDYSCCSRGEWEANAAYLRAVQPSRTLALLAENAALRVQVETEKRLSVENYKRASARPTGSPSLQHQEQKHDR